MNKRKRVEDDQGLSSSTLVGLSKSSDTFKHQIKGSSQNTNMNCPIPRDEKESTKPCFRSRSQTIQSSDFSLFESLDSRGLARPLIEWNLAIKQWEVNQETITQLHRLRGPLVVTFISGARCSGKSYLLNLLKHFRLSFAKLTTQTQTSTPSVNHKSPSPLAETSVPVSEKITNSQPSRNNVSLSFDESFSSCDVFGGAETVPSQPGIWLSVPYRVGNCWHLYLDMVMGPETLSINLLASSPTTQETTMQCLGLLLSTIFITQTQGILQSSHLEQLETIARVAKQIKVTNNKTQAVMEMVMPQLLWLIRDATPLPTTKFQEPQQDCNNNNKPISVKNIPFLDELFPQWEYWNLVRPVTDEALLLKLAHLPFSELRTAFQNQVRGLAERILLPTLNSNVCSDPSSVLRYSHSKRIGNVFVDGPMFANLCRVYTEAINKGSIPSIPSTWEVLVDRSTREAVESARSHYQRFFEPWFPVSEARHVAVDSSSSCLDNNDSTCINQVRGSLEINNKSQEGVKFYNLHLLEKQCQEMQEACIEALEKSLTTNNSSIVEVIRSEIQDRKTCVISIQKRCNTEWMQRQINEQWLLFLQSDHYNGPQLDGGKQALSSADRSSPNHLRHEESECSRQSLQSDSSLTPEHSNKSLLPDTLPLSKQTRRKTQPLPINKSLVSLDLVKEFWHRLWMSVNAVPLTSADREKETKLSSAPLQSNTKRKRVEGKKEAEEEEEEEEEQEEEAKLSEGINHQKQTQTLATFSKANCEEFYHLSAWFIIRQLVACIKDKFQEETVSVRFAESIVDQIREQCKNLSFGQWSQLFREQIQQHETNQKQQQTEISLAVQSECKSLHLALAETLVAQKEMQHQLKASQNHQMEALQEKLVVTLSENQSLQDWIKELHDEIFSLNRRNPKNPALFSTPSKSLQTHSSSLSNSTSLSQTQQLILDMEQELQIQSNRIHQQQTTIEHLQTELNDQKQKHEAQLTLLLTKCKLDCEQELRSLLLCGATVPQTTAFNVKTKTPTTEEHQISSISVVNMPSKITNSSMVLQDGVRKDSKGFLSNPLSPQNDENRHVPSNSSFQTLLSLSTSSSPVSSTLTSSSSLNLLLDSPSLSNDNHNMSSDNKSKCGESESKALSSSSPVLEDQHEMPFQPAPLLSSSHSSPSPINFSLVLPQ